MILKTYSHCHERVCSGKTKSSTLVPCCAKTDSGPVWFHNCVCVHARVLQIEQVSQLAALVQAQLEYHSRSAEILQQLASKMEDR